MCCRGMHGVSLNDVAILVTDWRYNTTKFQKNNFDMIWVINQDCDNLVYDFVSNPRLQRVLTYLLHFFRQEMQRHALLRKPFIIMTDLVTHAWDGSTHVRVLASIPTQGEGSWGEGCWSSLATQQNHLFLILALLRSVFFCVDGIASLGRNGTLWNVLPDSCFCNGENIQFET